MTFLGGEVRVHQAQKGEGNVLMKETSCVKEEIAKDPGLFWEPKEFEAMKQRLSQVAVTVWRQER